MLHRLETIILQEISEMLVLYGHYYYLTPPPPHPKTVNSKSPEGTEIEQSGSPFTYQDGLHITTYLATVDDEWIVTGTFNWKLIITRHSLCR